MTARILIAVLVFALAAGVVALLERAVRPRCPHCGSLLSWKSGPIGHMLWGYLPSSPRTTTQEETCPRCQRTVLTGGLRL